MNKFFFFRDILRMFLFSPEDFFLGIRTNGAWNTKIPERTEYRKFSFVRGCHLLEQKILATIFVFGKLVLQYYLTRGSDGSYSEMLKIFIAIIVIVGFAVN